MLSFNFELLRNQRRKRGLNQEQWGKLLGVTGATVSNWERGDSFPTAQELSKIATICGVADINIYFCEGIGNNEGKCKG